MSNIHPSSCISPKAHVASDAEIGPFCVVEAEAVIGEGTVIESHAVVRFGTRMGRENYLAEGVVLGGLPQHKQQSAQSGQLIIGDRNTFREYVSVHRSTHPELPTRIGSDNNLLAYSHVAHDVVLGNHCILSNCAQLAGHVVLEDYVILSGLSGVHQFCRVGAHVMVGGCTKVVQDVPPYTIVDGTPAQLRGLNLVGLQRRGFSKGDIFALKTAYKTLFLKKESILSTQIEILRTSDAAENEKVRKILDFLQSSERGFVR